MPTLDVSEILDDPAFRDGSLVCLRRTQMIGSDGIATETQQSLAFAGVVTVDRARQQSFTPDATRIDGAILVHTTFDLRVSDGGSGIADRVLWHGREYTVDDLDDYTDYGHRAAHCSLVPIHG